MTAPAPLITAPIGTLDALQSLPVGAVIRDKDQDKAVRTASGAWKYPMPHGRAPLLVSDEQVFRSMSPLHLVSTPRPAVTP